MANELNFSITKSNFSRKNSNVQGGGGNLGVSSSSRRTLRDYAGGDSTVSIGRSSSRSSVEVGATAKPFEILVE